MEGKELVSHNLPELLKVLSTEFQHKINTPIKPRHLPYPKPPKKIHSIIGMRRTGKSYFQLSLIHTLIKKELGVSLEPVYLGNYMDFLQSIAT